MGVPKLFAWLLRHHRDTLVSMESVGVVEVLCLDWNCGIHPCCQEVVKDYCERGASFETIEAAMRKRVLAYLEHLIQTVKPTKAVMIAVDGVPPVAKMAQQRRRRFKSSQDRNVTASILRRHGEDPPATWDNSQITPGTEFMERLHQSLLEFIRDSLCLRGLRCVYSSHHTPNEGEHKIMHYLRDTDFRRVAIYGLDADLIFLAMTLPETMQTFLLREDTHLQSRPRRPKGAPPQPVAARGGWPALRYLDVQALSRSLEHEMSHGHSFGKRWPPRTWRDDFVVLGILLGNDFLPHPYVLSIEMGGVEKLLQSYHAVVRKGRRSIVDPKTRSIRWEVLAQIVAPLARGEDKMLRGIHVQRKSRRRRTPPQDLGPAHMEVWRYQNPGWTTPPDPVKPGTAGWRDRLYRLRFPEGVKQDTVARQFCRGIEWCWRYYCAGVPDWRWDYGYLYAPSLQEVHHELERLTQLQTGQSPGGPGESPDRRRRYTDISDQFRFTVGRPVSMPVQLASVLSQHSRSYLPQRYREVLGSDTRKALSDVQFPSEFEEDVTHAAERWQAVPLISALDIDMVDAVVGMLSLSPEEETRAQTLGPFVVRR